MNATVNVLNLTALMPGAHQLAQLYTDYPPSIDRAASHKNRLPAAKILKRMSLKPRISRRRCCQNTIIELHQVPLIASLEIVLKRTDIQRRTRTEFSYLQISETCQYLN
ncbi:hypothetical protein [Microcoleus sp. herbarium14]|uniref:hypothetical protein n=1 Tax=Microcoleus sp. herbarium14 TaxID=3055439 RepID=UPI002FCE7351